MNTNSRPSWVLHELISLVSKSVLLCTARVRMRKVWESQLVYCKAYVGYRFGHKENQTWIKYYLEDVTVLTMINSRWCPWCSKAAHFVESAQETHGILPLSQQALSSTHFQTSISTPHKYYRYETQISFRRRAWKTMSFINYETLRHNHFNKSQKSRPRQFHKSSAMRASILI